MARTGLENYPSARTVMNSIGETFARLLSWLRGFEFPAGHPWPTRLLFLLGWYETETVAICKKMLRPGMVVLDIGAHNGYFTLLFSRLVGPSGRVFAFEPHEPTCRLLRRNLRRARHDNVTVVPHAVADRPGAAPFFEMSLAGTHSLFDVARFDPHFTLLQQGVTQCITVDEFLAAQGNPAVHFIKMDIEGAEPKALRGMTETIRRSISLALIVEFNLASLRAAGTTPHSFLAQLSGLGFDLHVITGRGDLVPIDDRLLRAAQQCPMNLLCTRKRSDS
ncbi:MAG: FkbM family methyltransferase [Acidobacteria bacterium]|nr:FkbM family methyltransferase [Acidobacteriota bacterium]